MTTYFKDTISLLKDASVPSDESKLYIPMGLDEKGYVYCARLTCENKYQHAAVVGQIGSGKSNALRYALACMQVLYAGDVKVHCLAGKADPLRQWVCKPISQGVFRQVHTASDFSEKLDTVTTAVCKDGCRSVVILDDALSYLSEDYPDAIAEFERLSELATDYNSHILLAEQQRLIPAVSEIIQKWSAIGITRASYDVSKYYHGNTMATTCTDKYGNMVVQHRNSHAVLRVPLIMNEDVEKLNLYVESHDRG